MNKSGAISLQSLKKKEKTEESERKRESKITIFKYSGLISTPYTEIVSILFSFFSVPQI